MTTCEIRFPLPTKPKSYNQTAGRHWASTNTAKHAWLDATIAAFTAAADTCAPLRGQRVLIRVAIPMPDKRRRDPHNYVPTVVKPIVDGIVRSGVLIPDDNSDWCEVAEPCLWTGDRVVVRIEPAGDPWVPDMNT